jgi:nitroreductase
VEKWTTSLIETQEIELNRDLVWAVDTVIQRRHTSKIIGNIDAPANVPEGFQSLVAEAVTVAGWAPFHKPAHETHRHHDLSSIVPWRFHVFDDQACRALLDLLKQLAEVHNDSKWLRGKVPNMLSAAGALVQATWLPDPPPEGEIPDSLYFANLQNTEHIAAASAAIQNLLLAVTARGILSYWSSGGVLREPEILDLCGIPPNQQLLGAVFLFPATTEGMTVLTGKLRNKRGYAGDWTRWVAADLLRQSD